MKVILLAAGLSKRMGTNKLVRPVHDTCLLEIAIRTALSYTDRLAVVTGYEREKTAFFAARYNAEEIFNPDYELGQESSLRRALLSCEEDIIVLPADLPFITKEDYLTAETMLKGYEAARPLYDGQPGHPVALAESLVRKYRSESRTIVRDLIGQSRHNYYTSSRKACIQDIDTEEAFQNFLTGKQ